KGKFRDAGPGICDEIANPGHRSACQEIMKVHQGMPKQTKKQDVFRCFSNDAPDHREGGVAYSLLLSARQYGPREQCDLFPRSWESFRVICNEGFSKTIPGIPGGSRAPGESSTPKESSGQAIPVSLGQNVLLTRAGDNGFVDKAREFGVQESGFTWNAKFADL